jgi:antitoxin (DNA-binding transcriptional repressor) of toxin-antitoxin stability system
MEEAVCTRLNAHSLFSSALYLWLSSGLSLFIVSCKGRKFFGSVGFRKRREEPHADLTERSVVVSTVITIEEAQAKLPELLAKLAPGEAVIITQDDQPVAELHPIAREKSRPKFGSCKGMLTIVAEDEGHLEDFKEYMP